MKKIYAVLLLSVIVQSVWSQCGTLYKDYVFSTFTKTNVVYSTAYNQDMDIYVPDGDNSTSRPLMLLCHGGSFFSGNKDEQNLVDLCERFAKRGYVTASINYRLTSAFSLADSLQMLDAVMKAIGDAKAAVRYFTKDAATTNTYKVDPNRVFIGGNSAGAILAIHYAYIDDTAGLPLHVKTAVTNNGGIDGNSGNAGYSSTVKGIYNLCGGINNLAWINASDEPIISFHGDADQVVQYNCGDVYEQPPYNTLDLIDLCGSNAMKPVLDQAGILNEFHPYPGQGHSPWSSSPSLFEEVDSFGRNFFYNLLCNTAINEPNSVSHLAFFPNPSATTIEIDNLNSSVTEVVISDLSGRILSNQNIGYGKNLINVSELSKGIFTIQTKDVYGKTFAVSKLIKN